MRCQRCMTYDILIRIGVTSKPPILPINISKQEYACNFVVSIYILSIYGHDNE